MSKRTMFCALFATALGIFCMVSAFSQQPTDTAAQASPTTTPVPAPVDDDATQSSPTAQGTRHAASVSVAAHSALVVQLAHAADSGKLKNGQTLPATLAAPVRLTSGKRLAEGAAAQLTVIATVPAGKISAVGEMSLQVISVGGVAVNTDTLTYRGHAGHKDLPDSAPATGTDAGLAQGATLTFHVQPQPAMASGPPRGTHQGLVNGVSSGDAPPKKTPSGTPPQ